MDRGYRATPVALEFVPEHLMDYDLCLKAVANDGAAYDFVPPYFLTAELHLAAYERCMAQYGFVPSAKLRRFDSEEKCAQLVSRDGAMLEFVPPRFRSRRVCEAARLRGGAPLTP